MFKKLKEKIQEEVSQTPQKFQQLAQAAGYNVSNNDVNTDKFFSITEETPQNSPHHQPLTGISLNRSLSPNYTNNGAIASRTRRLSNSSQASDVSFKLPVYDSPAVYHLQSDMESASELDEAAPTVQMGQLDLVSKEQLHQAYRKALDRYQKYRGMYTDLARKYRELERDNTKARSVLVETQDKALRRISELREQCSLEQQAKAHLEAALRLEMDELQCVVKTLTTKLELLDENPETVVKNGKNEPNLIHLENDDAKGDTTSQESSDFSSPLTSQSTDLDRKVADLESQLKQYKEQIMEKEAKIIIVTDECEKMKAQLLEVNTVMKDLQSKDEQNTISIAENKMVIHSELEAKETETKTLKEKIAILESNLIKASKENYDVSEQIKTLKKQLLESKTMSQANNEVMNEKLKELEAALKATSDEKHKLELTLMDVEKNLSNFSMENIGLKESISSTKDEKNQLDEKYSKVKRQITELQEELKQALNENDILKANAEEIYEHLFHEKDDGSPENVKRLKDYVKEVANKLDAMVREKKCLTEDKLKIEQKLKELFDDKQAVTAKLKEAEDALDKNVKEIENLKLQADSLVSVEDKIVSLRQEYEEKLTAANAELEQKSEELKNIKQELETLKISEQTRANDISNLQKQLESTETAKTALEERIEKLTQEYEVNLSSVKAGDSESKQELADKIAQISNLEKGIEAITLERDSLNLELTKANEQTKQLQSEKQVLEQKCEDLSTQLKQENHEKQDHVSEANTLKSKVELLRKEKSDLEKTLEREIREKVELKTQVTNILKEITRLEEQLNEVKTSHSIIQKEKETLEAKIEKLHETKKQEKDINQKWEEKCTELESKLNEKQAEMENIRQLNNNLEQQVRNAQDELERVRSEVDILRQNEMNEEIQAAYETRLSALNERLAETEEQATTAKTQLQQCSEDNAKLFNEKELLEHKVRSLQDDLEMKEKEKLTILDTNQCLADSISEQKTRIELSSQSLQSLEEQKNALTETCDSLMEKVDALKKENISLRAEREQFQQRLEDIQSHLEAANNKYSIRESKIRMLTDENKTIKTDLDSNVEQLTGVKANLDQCKSENTELLTKIQALEQKLQDFDKDKCDDNVTTQEISELQLQLEQLRSENSRLSTEINNNQYSDYEKIKHDRDELNEKLKKIMHEVQDVSNRNLFLEQKCENYLILEQSNERLKNQNEKLSRQLDETLVSLHHNEGLSANTEFEYLRNILFQYLSGSAGTNGKTLVKVISAVLKFTPQQTQVVLEKESQRHTLVGQLNNLL